MAKVPNLWKAEWGQGSQALPMPWPISLALSIIPVQCFFKSSPRGVGSNIKDYRLQRLREAQLPVGIIACYTQSKRCSIIQTSTIVANGKECRCGQMGSWSMTHRPRYGWKDRRQTEHGTDRQKWFSLLTETRGLRVCVSVCVCVYVQVSEQLGTREISRGKIIKCF